MTNVVYFNTTTKEVTYGPTSAGASISNGTSNVRIATSGGNISFNINGSAAGFITNEFPLKSSVALGVGAGTLGNGGIAIGYTAGSLNQGFTSIAIGPEAGRDNQGITAIAIGTQAGLSTQGDQGIAIGVLAGSSGQGANAIAIGRGAGKTNQSANSIIINATGSDLNGANSGLYVAPVRNDTGNIAQVVTYNTSTKEVTYANTINLAGNVSAGNVNVTGNVTGSSSNVTLVSGSYSWTFDNTSTVSFPGPARLAVYANATARDAAITSPQTGMMVYVTGVGMQVRGATAWNTITGTGT